MFSLLTTVNHISSAACRNHSSFKTLRFADSATAKLMTLLSLNAKWFGHKDRFKDGLLGKTT